MVVENPVMQRMLSERRAALGMPPRDPQENIFRRKRNESFMTKPPLRRTFNNETSFDNAGANTDDSPEPTGTGTTAIPSSSDSPCDGEHHRTYSRSHPQRQQPPNNSYIFVTKSPTLGEPQSIFKNKRKPAKINALRAAAAGKEAGQDNVNETAACQSQSPNIGSRC
ncbi:hypothetical protein YC2023_102445 [Brassica napus]